MLTSPILVALGCLAPLTVVLQDDLAAEAAAIEASLARVEAQIAATTPVIAEAAAPRSVPNPRVDALQARLAELEVEFVAMVENKDQTEEHTRTQQRAALEQKIEDLRAELAEPSAAITTKPVEARQVPNPTYHALLADAADLRDQLTVVRAVQAAHARDAEPRVSDEVMARIAALEDKVALLELQLAQRDQAAEIDAEQLVTQADIQAAEHQARLASAERAETEGRLEHAAARFAGARARLEQAEAKRLALTLRAAVIDPEEEFHRLIDSREEDAGELGAAEDDLAHFQRLLAELAEELEATAETVLSADEEEQVANPRRAYLQERIDLTVRRIEGQERVIVELRDELEQCQDQMRRMLELRAELGSLEREIEIAERRFERALDALLDAESDLYER